MEYCILNADGVIENIIVSDKEFAESIGAKESYNGAAIGLEYNPPEKPFEPTLGDRVTSLENENKVLSAQIQAQCESTDFLEDCLVEMASIVYAE